MITSRKAIAEFLKKSMITQHECNCQFWMSEKEEWDVKKQVDYINGVVLGKFRENDALTRKILKEGVTDKALITEINIKLKRKIKNIEKLEHPNSFHKKELKLYKKQQDELSLFSMDEWISKNCGLMVSAAEGVSYSEKRVLLYLDYAFDNYKAERQHPFCSDLSELDKEYKSILGKHSQYRKYGLVPVDKMRELIPINPPRIYDKELNKTFFTKNVPMELLENISEMMLNGLVEDFSVRLLNEPGYKGKSNYVYITEELERGRVFDFVNLGKYSVTKLYSQKYEDCMWVVIDAQNITFEELYDNFETYNDMIVTQVVHLQYEKESDSVYITHLDHEYIFYTIDEYKDRMSNVAQKGTAKTRIKSFKIDNSEIPFNYKCKVLRKDENGNDLSTGYEQFLCYILECYFKHKDLLKEYFHKVLG